MFTALVLLAADTPPEDEDVVAGGWGAIVLVGLIIAVVLLGFSLSKQLRKAQAAEDAGLYDHDDDRAAAAPDSPVTPAEPASGETVTDHKAEGQQP
jgi:hypothetical protein